MNSKAPCKVLVIDDDAEIRYSLERVLSSNGYKVVLAPSGEQGLQIANEVSPSVILLDNRMGGITGVEALQHLRTSVPKSMVVLMTAYGTTQTAIEAMKYGAFDYIIKPFDLKKILGIIKKAYSASEDLLVAENRYESLLNSEDYKEGIVGDSEAMQEVFKTMGQVTASDVTVLITGESGTGKELVANAVHQHSLRHQERFVGVNCAAIPENLIESELFGHEKGSFTGAIQQHKGQFEIADRGTIFLDEIGDMALTTQTKILRVLQEGEIQRVGGNKSIKVAVRLIAATNKNLEEMVKQGRFREDLYYRLNVVRVRLPSLRERIADIPKLVDFMLQRLQKKRKIQVNGIANEVLTVFSKYNWPGNVRELENLVYRSAVIAQGKTILLKDLPEDIIKIVASKSDPQNGGFKQGSHRIESQKTISKENLSESKAIATSQDLSETLIGIHREPLADLTVEKAYDYIFEQFKKSGTGLLLEKVEKEMIQRTLTDNKGNQVKSAKILGLTRVTLRKRITMYDLKY